ncbi:MAG: energy transducer TonB [Blastocatellia bacterium]
MLKASKHQISFTLTSLLLLAGYAFLVNVPAQAQVRRPMLGIVNGRATYLPKPLYPREANDVCADGKVEVEVLVNKKGRVMAAKAVSGDDLLTKSAVAAARRAKFRTFHGQPKQLRGIVVYDFDSLSKCVEAGVVNKKANSIPKPQVATIIHPPHLQINQVQTVKVQIVIDEEGDVISARAVSGHPLLRAACIRSAVQAKFPATLINPGPLKVKAFLIYTFKPDGTIEF